MFSGGQSTCGIMEMCAGDALTLDLTAYVQESMLPELEGETLVLDSRELASRKRRRYITTCETSSEDDDFQVRCIREFMLLYG